MRIHIQKQKHKLRFLCFEFIHSLFRQFEFLVKEKSKQTNSK